MKVLILEILNSKIEFNKKCLKSKIKFETLKSYLNIHFKNKYGLKKMKNESINNFLLSLAKYINQDIDSYVFYSILNFDIDEDFIYIHKEIKKTLIDSFKIFLRKEYRMKNEKFINDIIEKKLGDKKILEKNEILFLVKEMTGNDSEEISKKILEKGETFFKNLNYEICLFFLNRHKSLLFGIKSLFKKFDKKNNGVLTKVI